MPAAAATDRTRLLLGRARTPAAVLLLLATLAGLVPLTATAVGAQENGTRTTVVDVDQLELQIAYAPHPPRPDETVLLISRITGPEAMLDEVDHWWYDWNVEGDAAEPDPSPVGQARHVTRRQFPTTGDRTVSLTICPTVTATIGCLQTERTIAVVEGTTPVEPPIDFSGSFRRLVEHQTFDFIDFRGGGAIGTYFRLEDQLRPAGEASFSRPGDESSLALTPGTAGTYTATIAACFADPDLRCTLRENLVTVHPTQCHPVFDTEPGDLTPRDLTISRLDNNAGLRLGWTNDRAPNPNVAFTIEAGPSLTALSQVPNPVGNALRHECQMQAVRVTDPEIRCFRVTVHSYRPANYRSTSNEGCPAIDRHVSSTSGAAGSAYVGEIELTADSHGSGRMDLEVRFNASAGELGDTAGHSFFVNFTDEGETCSVDDFVAVDIDEFGYETNRTDATGAPVRTYTAVLSDRPQEGRYDVQVARQPCSEVESVPNPDWVALASALWWC